MGGAGMMKKLVFFALIPFVLFTTFSKGVNDQVVEEEVQFQVIPDEAIRLRILANSDNDEDQEVKHIIRNEVNDQISGWVEHLTSIEAARDIIKSRLPEITETVENVLEQLNSPHAVEVDYGENITFPLKLYDSFIYPPGEYEAVLITIGEGKGSNWWCVLFPPLCFLDFSNGSTVADNNEVDLSDESAKDKINFIKIGRAHV